MKKTITNIKVCFYCIAFLFLSQVSFAQTCIDPPPSLDCGAGVPIALSSEDFESGLGSFTQSTADDIDWTLNSGSTTTIPTGPSDDACGGGNYLYVETSFPTFDGYVACLSTTVDLTTLDATDPAIASLWYHAFGQCTGDFDLSINGGAAVVLVSGEQQTANDDPWLQLEIDLDGLQGTIVTLDFCYTVGTTDVDGCVDIFNGDFAIDQFTVWSCIPPCMISCQPAVIVENDLGLCSATIDAATIGVPTFMGGCFSQSGGAPMLTNDYTGTASAGGEYPLDTTTITWTLYDFFGDSVNCTQDIIVVDSELPVLDCPGNTTFSLDGGECSQWYFFNTSASDNCPGTFETQPDPLAPVGYNTYESGDFLPIGQHCFQYVTSDAAGNEGTCSWCVDVLEYPNPSSTLSCNDGINVTVNSACEAVICADAILEGGPYGCYDNYNVTVEGIPANAIIGNGTACAIIDATMIPEFVETGMFGPFEVTVTDPATGNSCGNDGWMIEDKTAPIIMCDTVEIACTVDPTPGVGTNEPIVSENCGDYSLSFVESETAGSCGDPYASIIERVWTATDTKGNSAQCVQLIQVTFGALAEVVFPPSYDNLDQPALSCEDPNTDPSNTGEPTGASCNNIGFTYSDSDSILLCGDSGNSFKVIRTWTVVEWCTGDILTATQVIKVLDEEAPVVVCPSAIEVSTSLSTCEASVLINGDSINVTDNCSMAVGLTATVSTGSITQLGNDWNISGLPMGTHTLAFTATDECDNSSSCSFEITVVDGINPIAICETFHTIALVLDQPTLVDASVFDAGSYDYCSAVTFDVRRMDSCIDYDWTTDGPGLDATPDGNVNDADMGTGPTNSQNVGWYPEVPFSCCDVGNPVAVVFRVTDEEGNRNTCMVTVEVQDKIDGVISCPDDMDYDCTASIHDPADLPLDGVSSLANGGPAAYYYDGVSWNFAGYYLDGYDNCGANVFILDRGGINNCGESYLVNPENQGPIRRYFAIYPATTPIDDVPVVWNQFVFGADDFCIQELNVENPNDFNENDITWPTDVMISCPSSPSATGSPTFSDAACSNVAASQEPDILVPLNDDTACYKILRTWVVIDWCAYDGNGAGYWEDTQVIKVLDSEAPSIVTACTSQNFYINTDNDGDFTNGCTATVDLEVAGTDNCTSDTALEWSWEVDEYNDGTIDYTGNGNSLSGIYPVGFHQVTWTLSDGCGNYDQCNQMFEVIDDTAPLVYADNGLEVNLATQGGGVAVATLWANDFDEGSSDECSGICDMRIFSPSAGAGQLAPPVTAQNDGLSVSFDCDDLGNNTIDFWVKDCSNNWSYISTFVILEDNGLGCNGIGLTSISGEINTESGEGVENVSLDLTGYMVEDMMTATDGLYAFYNLPINQNYTVAPTEGLDVLNGVSTYDLVLISKHILELQPLDSPYKLIAADVNSSGAITTFDLVELRKLILFIETEFPNDDASWRFVPADFVFPTPTNPWFTSFPEETAYNNLTVDEVANFVAIKKGDVNGSAIPNSLLGGNDRTMVGDLVFNINDRAMVEGQEYTVDFTANDFSNVMGYQFSLAFDTDAVEFVSVDAGVLSNMTAANFGLAKLNEGVITTSWNEQVATNLVDEDVVFSVTFKATSNTQLSDVMTIGSRYTVAEAYNKDLELLNVAIEYNQDGAAVTANDFALNQNQPNPFKGSTVISFILPEAQAASLKIYDVSGRVLLQVEGNYAKGFNEVTVNRSDLNGAGVLYYQLDTDTDSAIKKMITIE